MGDIKYMGFTSRKNAHRHLLKHVLRVAALDRGELSNTKDPERWDEILSDPPLPPGRGDRRKLAVAALDGVDGCLLAGRLPSKKSRCDDCDDSGAQERVDSALGPVLTAYDAAARSAFEDGRRLAYQGERGAQLEALAPNGVFAIGRFDEKNRSVRTITCFRTRHSSEALAQARRRAGFLITGSLIDA